MKLKRGEIAVYAISLMLVAAGYFNYVTFEQKTQETYSEDLEGVNEEYAGVGDAVLVSNNESENNTNDNQEVEEENIASVNDKENEIEEDTAVKTEDKEQVINSVDVSSNTEEENYYASSKLDRDKMYAEMISSYEGILNNPNVSEAQKSIATQEITKINNAKNAIMICENLILTKGFNNCIIFVNDDIINVVVNITGGLETKDVAKVQNIISRELNTGIENIHITER